MEILTPDKYDEYEQFVQNHVNGSFMQSLNWPKVKNNWEFEAIVSRDSNGNIRGSMLILMMKTPVLGSRFMYSPRGPVCDYNDTDTLSDLMDGARDIAKKHKGYQLKIDPAVLASDSKIIDNFKAVGFDFKPGASFKDAIQTRYNYMLTGTDSMTRDSFLKHVGRDTRYNMRLPLKKGVRCEWGDSSKIDDFYAVYTDTGSRQSFSVRPASYLKRFIDSFGDSARLYICYSQDNIPLCGGIAIQYAGKTCHVYGGSSSSMRNLRATYLLQWEMINWAIDGASMVYDMQGVCIDPAESAALYGVYEFKQNFNGSLIEYAGEFDFVFSPSTKKLIDTAQNVKNKMKHKK